MLASEIKISKSTLRDALNRGDVVCRAKTFKPLVTDQNKFDHMKLGLSFITGTPREKSTFVKA